MFNLLGGLRVYFARQEIVVDNPIFRIHSTFTTVLLLTFSMIVTWTQFVGQPIRCLGNGAVPAKVINTYCWIMSTFTVPDAFRRPSSEVAHPGVANSYDEEWNQKYYTYYQWVCFVLFLQALMCYFPKWLWQTWERGLMSTIVCGLNVGLRSDDEKKKKKGIVVDYLIRHLNQHTWYTLHYWFCELLCLANVIFQMFLMNWFFKGDFFTYGWDVLTFDDIDQEDRVDNMVYVFPRVTKCTFRKFGPSGSIEIHDSLCILPLNIVNEKTYIFLWFWYIILAALCLSVVLFRVGILFIPRLRSHLLYTQNRMAKRQLVHAISNKVSVGDWWVLYMLGRNIDPQIYKEVVEEFGGKYRAK